MTMDRLLCDGCGQLASAEHIARRLQRLEWTTRYRPVHIGTLLLSAIAPQQDADFLYAGKSEGKAARLLEVVGIQPSGKATDAVLSEFQRAGYFLAYLLDCPVEPAQANCGSEEALLAARVGPVAARIRRSLKRKRTVLISERLGPLADRFSESELGCPVLLDHGKPFALDLSPSDDAIARLRETLAGAAARL